MTVVSLSIMWKEGVIFQSTTLCVVLTKVKGTWFIQLSSLKRIWSCTRKTFSRHNNNTSLLCGWSQKYYLDFAFSSRRLLFLQRRKICFSMLGILIFWWNFIVENEIWELVATNLFSTKYIDYKLCDTFIRMEVKCSTSLRTSMDYKRAELRHFMGRINIWCEQSLSFFFLGLETLSMHKWTHWFMILKQGKERRKNQVWCCSADFWFYD